jgi:imidazolonepropionase-like amidohydrolase
VGGRIEAVAPWQPAGPPVTYDLARYTVLPGLIDAHVHIAGYFNRLGQINRSGDGETGRQQAAGVAANALATLRAGFTTVASMGAWGDRALRESIRRGKLPGPRILTSLDPIRDSSLSLGDLETLVRHHARDHADFIKIFESNSVMAGGTPTFSVEQLTLMCHQARALGLRTVVHAQSDASLKVAAAAGCDEIEHGILATEAGLKLLAERGIYFDPQCGLILRNYLEHRNAYRGIRGFDSAAMSYMNDLLPSLPKVTRMALGIPGLKLLYGTDATAGAHGRNAEDLICRVREAGQSPMDALVTATSRNASALGLGNQVGTIGPGYQADLIATDGNPVEEIEAVLRVRFVMKDGTVFLAP